MTQVICGTLLEVTLLRHWLGATDTRQRRRVTGDGSIPSPTADQKLELKCICQGKAQRLMGTRKSAECLSPTPYRLLQDFCV